MTTGGPTDFSQALSDFAQRDDLWNRPIDSTDLVCCWLYELVPNTMRVRSRRSNLFVRILVHLPIDRVARLVDTAELNHTRQILLIGRQIKKGQLTYQPWYESNDVLVCVKRYEFHGSFVLKISVTTTRCFLRL